MFPAGHNAPHGLSPIVPPRSDTVSITMVQQLKQAQADRKDTANITTCNNGKQVASIDDLTSMAPTEADSDVFGVIGARKNGPKKELTTFKASAATNQKYGTTVHSYRI